MDLRGGLFFRLSDFRQSSAKTIETPQLGQLGLHERLKGWELSWKAVQKRLRMILTEICVHPLQN